MGLPLLPGLLPLLHLHPRTPPQRRELPHDIPDHPEGRTSERAHSGRHKLKVHSVSQLVATTFLVPDAARPLVLHLDGDRSNSALSNIRWASHGEIFERQQLSGASLIKLDQRRSPKWRLAPAHEGETWRNLSLSSSGTWLDATTINQEEIPDGSTISVSSLGRIRNARGRNIAGTVHHGLRVVSLKIGGKRRRDSFCGLVCRAFHGPPPGLRDYVVHLDNDTTNDAASNLAWKLPIRCQGRAQL
jgi:hypothetical protein